MTALSGWVVDMWRVTWKSITSHKLRLFTTSLSIALGVAFIAGALMLGATMTKTFDDLFSTAYEHTDAVVRGPSDLTGGNEDNRPLIDESLASKVATIPGVRLASPELSGFAQLVDTKGEAVATGGAPQYGTAWDRNSDITPWKIRDGAAPSNESEVVIDAGVAKKAKLKVGDNVSVLTEVGRHPVTISGIAKFQSVDSPATAQFVLFYDLATTQKVLGQPGKISIVNVVGEKGISEDELVNRIKPVLDGGIEVVTGRTAEKESRDSVVSFLNILTTVLAVFGGIALFVAAFIINNTFSIILAQRSKEMALLRAIGATRRQVLKSVMLEATFTGFFASLIGLVLGIAVSSGLQALMKAFGADLPTSGLVIPTNAVVIALVAGTIITIVSAYLPARRSSKIPPVAALREFAIDESARGVRRFIIGFIIAALGLASVICGLTISFEDPLIYVGVGAALVFIGVYLLTPMFARPAGSVIGWPIVKFGRQTGLLARENAIRNPRRTSATASALMIGVTLVTIASVFFTSVKASMEKVVDRSFGGDFMISSENFTGQTGVPLTVADQLRQRNELGIVSSVQWPPVARVNGKEVGITAVDPRDFDRVMDLQVQQGNFRELGDNEIAISERYAEDNDLAVGSVVELETQGGVSKRAVDAIYEDATLVGNFVVTINSIRDAGIKYDGFIFVNRADGVTAERARAVVHEVIDPYLTLNVQDGTELKKQMTEEIDGVLTIFIALLLLAVIIALIGIANTLALSVFERTRELGLLRAVGMTRWQARWMICWESVIVAFLGTLLGLIIGTAFGAALVWSARDIGIEVLDMPWSLVATILVVAFVSGILAAVFPARRAAKLDVLKAIATE